MDNEDSGESREQKESKEKKEIDMPVDTIGDILKIVETNIYEDQYEYNIDLKALHNIQEELAQLNAIIGMEKVKKSILQQMIYFIQNLHIPNITETSTSSDIDIPKKNYIIANDYKHTIISGPPGTGKTEIAKIIGKMYSKLGILKNNIFRKVTRNDLVAGYLGQTAIKTKKVIEECIGGVLFIDEAYSLGLDDAFSKECVDTLCEALSDHRDDLMVIVAGYDMELRDTFFRINQGMQSRFMWKFVIDKYDSLELMDILYKKIRENGWEFSFPLENTEETMESGENTRKEEKERKEWFKKNKNHFPNYGRDMELLFSYMKISHAQRIFGKEKNLRKKLTKEDLENGMILFLQNKKENGSNNNTTPMGMYI
jgi:SpoVK/Ycf46/Vps4 family AAA+-type ATPase